MAAIADVFLNSRADHLSPEALFAEFIVPPFFKRISIFGDKKSVRVLGGRGCGKTMFIRYFGHGTALSPSRTDIPDDELRSVGLYFRPDTEFCRLMSGAWLGDQQAKLAFGHYVALSLLVDACRSVKSIEAAKFSNGRVDLGDPILGPVLAKQLSVAPCRISQLGDELDVKLVELESWVRNPSPSSKPTFVHFASVISRFANELAKLSPRVEHLAFRAFVDEFENLPESHREVVCDAIKHPSERLAVHIAHKKEAVVDFKTSSDERIVEIHDLTTIDLEEELSKAGEFEVLAAELFLLKIKQADVPFDCPLFNADYLHDPRHLDHRLSEEYRKQVLRCVREMLPGATADEIAAGVITDEALKRRLKEMIKKGLELQRLPAPHDLDVLMSEAHPQASVVLGALLNRTSQNGKEILKQFEISVKHGQTSNDPFFKIGGWIDNNLYGCLFHLYAGLPRRPNILYAGFDRFCMMASPNLRFFQALCHSALLLEFERKSSGQLAGSFRVDMENQAKAARKVSEMLFKDILQLGSHGVQLVEITGRLGRVFEAFNRRRSQSEPEINHFSIDAADRVHLAPEAEMLLREAKVWSVIYEAKDTKNKSDYDIAQTDLILNPIYAPHFGISYRKRRKVTLPASYANVILCQSTEQFESILKLLVAPNERDSNESQHLF